MIGNLLPRLRRKSPGLVQMAVNRVAPTDTKRQIITPYARRPTRRAELIGVEAPGIRCSVCDVINIVQVCREGSRLPGNGHAVIYARVPAGKVAIRKRRGPRIVVDFDGIPRRIVTNDSAADTRGNVESFNQYLASSAASFSLR